MRTGEFGHQQAASAQIANEAAEYRIGHAGHGRQYGGRSYAHRPDPELGWEAEHRLESSFYPALHWKRKREPVRPTQVKVRDHMKPFQIGLLVLVGALGGALIMKFTQRPKPAAAPIVAAVPAAAPVPAVPPPAAVPAPAAAPENTPPAPVSAPAPPDKPEPAPPPRPVHRVKPAHPAPPVTVAQNVPPAQPDPPAAPSPLPVQEPVAPPISNEPEPAPVPAPAATESVEPPAPTPAPSVTLPAGMTLPIRLGEKLSSENNQAGDTFTGTLDAPLSAGGFVIAEKGAHVEGRVVDAQKSSHAKGKAELSLELTKLHTSDGQHVAIKTETLRKQGETMATQDQVGIVAAAAGVGAIIGAIAGGGKGAAIGAGAGGAAGGGGVLATRDKAVTLPTESKLTFRLNAAITLTEQPNR